MRHIFTAALAVAAIAVAFTVYAQTRANPDVYLFVAANTGAPGVFRIDARDGSVSYCYARLSKEKPEGVVCLGQVK